ncbi:MAG: glycosyltransferase [Fibrobacteres bacterium]|nr:glycosyltransferase [Fibrobacterota bacterium]
MGNCNVVYFSLKMKINGFTILIPTWNNLSILKLCLERLARYSSYKHEIILHINEGIDGTLEFAKTSGLKYTYSAQNVGVCCALNQAAALATKSYICYMNDDMMVCQNWDNALIYEIEKRKSDLFYLSATMIEPVDTGNRCVISPKDYGRTPQDFRAEDLDKEYKLLSHADWNGASWPPSVVSKRIWDAVGGYSEEFSPGMYSDPDFSMKLWKFGVRDFLGVSASRVYHFMSKSVSKLKNRGMGRKLFLTKWGVSSSTFYRHILKLGTSYSGPLDEPSISVRFLLDRIRDRLKHLLWSRSGINKIYNGVSAHKLYEAYDRGEYKRVATFKDSRRSLVQQIEIDGQMLVVKIPREKNTRKWQRLLSIFRGGESFREFHALMNGMSKGIPVPRPVAAMERRKFFFVVDSLIIMEWMGGRIAIKEDAEAVSLLLRRIHDAGLLHGDAHLSNFIVDKKGGVMTIDCSLKRNFLGQFGIKYEFITLERSCIEPIQTYQKSGIAYYVALFRDWLRQKKLKRKHLKNLKSSSRFGEVQPGKDI